MIRNYFKIAYRTLVHNKVYSFINLVGLTFGLVTSMLIFQYVIFENSADRFHKNSDQIYRLALKQTVNNGTPEVFSQIFLGAGEAFKKEVPAVESFTRIRADFFQEGPTITRANNTEKMAIKDIRSIMTDPSFLTVFTFPLIRGDASTALQNPSSILLTASMAQRLFGDTDPIGKIIDYSLSKGPQNLIVTGVLQDPPTNSHIQFDVVLPLQNFIGSTPASDRQAWNFRGFTTYVKLRSDADTEQLVALMNRVVDRSIGELYKRINVTLSLQLQPMHSVYFDRKTDLGITGDGSALVTTRTGNQRMVYFFTIIASIIFLIALMNYVNLSTVRSLDRSKEVGVRKVLGALKINLKIQFFLETMLMNVAALVCAVIITLLLMSSFNSFVQTNFTLTSWFNVPFLCLLAAVFTVGVFLSGLYPAFILSSVSPITALKGKVGSLTSRSFVWRLLVVLQYTPAIALVVCTIVVYNQLDFMQKKDIGLQLDDLVTIRSPRFLPGNMSSDQAEAAFRHELRKISSIEGASYAGNQAGRGLNFLAAFSPDSADESTIKWIKCSGVDQDFANVFGLKVLAGFFFTEGMESTYGNPNDFVRKVVLNETAVRSLGFRAHKDAIGRVLTAKDGLRYYVLGIVKDFNWASAHKATDPVMLWYTPNNRFMTVRISSGADMKQTLAQLKSSYDKLFPTDVFHYEFATDVYNRQYGEDEKFTQLFGFFTCMAILIASLGLFGLSAFTAARRSKEVAVRRVLGASVGTIFSLLAEDFLKLVLLAVVIGSPLAWYAMNQWLQDFAYHISIQWWVFVLAGILTALIALLTVSFQIIKAALLNPVKSLRSE
ncbi:ABC transporter permease [Spirosoma linguale]